MRRAGLGVVGCGTLARRVALVLVCFVAAFVLAMEARAQTQPERAPRPERGPGPRLDYRGGPCLPEREFRHEVAILLDGHDYLGDGPDRVRVTFDRLPGGRFRGVVVYTDANGNEQPPTTKMGRTCEMLARSIAGTVTEYIPFPPEPEHAPEQEKPPDPPRAPPAFVPPILVQSLQPTPRKPLASEDMELTLTLSTGALITAGLTANVGGGFWIAGGVRGEVFSLDLELRGVLPGYVLATEQAPGTVKRFDQAFDYSQWTVGLTPCARWKYLVGCGVAQVGFGYIQTPASSASSLMVGVGPRLGFEVPFAERFAVVGFGEALFFPVQSGVYFDVDNAIPAANVWWLQPVVSAFFGAGLSVRFQ